MTCLNKTTMIRRNAEMKTQPFVKCHDGLGAVLWTDVSGPVGRQLKWIHDHVLSPGVSIGLHDHVDDEEYYYILSGSGLMTLDGVEYTVSAGDMTAIYPGGSHGLYNNTEEDLRVLVICLHTTK